MKSIILETYMDSTKLEDVSFDTIFSCCDFLTKNKLTYNAGNLYYDCNGYIAKLVASDSVKALVSTYIARYVA